MPRRHQCSGNDHISFLAAKYGFYDWRTIWKANPGLQGRRKNPNLLFKGDKFNRGDVLQIPDSETKDTPGATGKTWTFVLGSQTVYLRIRILSHDFLAVKNAQYWLSVEGLADPFTGRTDSNGQLQHEIPRFALTGQLTVRVPAGNTDNCPPSFPPSDGGGTPAGGGAAPSGGGAAPAGGGGAPAGGAAPAGGSGAPAGGGAPAPAGGGSTPPAPVRGEVPIVWNLQIGSLNPIMTVATTTQCISGVQQRLNNLCLNTGPVDGILGPNTKAAVRAFQSVFSLTVDGKPGQGQTQPKLVEVHDKPDSVLGSVPAPSSSSSSSSSSSPSPSPSPGPAPSGV